MAGRGPASNPNAIRRNKKAAPTKTKLDATGIPARIVKNDGDIRKCPGMALPKGVLGTKKVVDANGEEQIIPVEWHPITIKWWEAWRRSPLADQMLSEADWYFHLGTALIHHQMWTNGRWDFAAEVRLREAHFGATPLARKSLNIEIDVPEQAPTGTAPGANVTDISSRRSRLTGS